jgi:hypothetical protein
MRIEKQETYLSIHDLCQEETQYVMWRKEHLG